MYLVKSERHRLPGFKNTLQLPTTSETPQGVKGSNMGLKSPNLLLLSRSVEDS